ncbi:MAG: nitroreductase family protein [Alphaproteobacteria bacterium]|nr:nitroreductase family protein [Alphaproteobacteria bacterium]
MTNKTLKAFEKRHSIYNINNELNLTDLEIEGLINKALDIYPSAFNSQDARLILLMGEHHKYFWELVKKELFRVSKDNKKTKIEEKIAKFEAGYGTILFFIAPEIASTLEKSYPEYAPQFPIWAREGNAMLQFLIWSIFAENGIGASLQHFNPLIDEIIKQQFKINPKWEFVAQMPFGGIVDMPHNHTIKYTDERLTVRP